MAVSAYSLEEAISSIWVFLEHDQEELSGVSKELLSKGRQLADQSKWSVVGLLMGLDVYELAEKAVAYGADEVILIEDPMLTTFDVDAYADAAYRAIIEERPSIFLVGATPDGRDLAGRLAVRLRTGLNADCTDLRLDESRGVLVSEVTGFGGGIVAYIEMAKHRPQMATVGPGVFPFVDADKARKGRIIRKKVTLNMDIVRTRVIERRVGKGVDLTQALVLVVGGRGIEGEFGMLERLAKLLGGEVGATRPPVDDGFIERERQIGQTGVVCRPKVAIACGVSGAFHFVVGIQEADLVIAINTDADAPIFENADYCIVGDAFDLIPALSAALEKNPEVVYG